jgi:hypothetical protein
MSVSLANLVAQILAGPEVPPTREQGGSVICPRCGINDRLISPKTGLKTSYCRDCRRDKMKEYRTKK